MPSFGHVPGISDIRSDVLPNAMLADHACVVGVRVGDDADVVSAYYLFQDQPSGRRYYI